jgi:glycosyltransferase involved in cell wall biosynthesis
MMQRKIRQQMYRISVITICKNEERRISQTLSSVAQQTYPHIEWIVIDGASTDSTCSLIEPFRQRFQYYISEADSGVYSAQNKGARQATGDYLIFLNGGDFFASNEAVKILATAASGEDLVYGDLIITNNKGVERRGFAPDPFTFPDLMTSSVWHPSTLIKHDLFKKLGPYDESLKIAADYDFFAKAILLEQAQMKHVAQPIAVFHEDGLASREDLRESHLLERNLVQQRYVPKIVLNYYEEQLRAQRDSRSLARLLVKQWARKGFSFAPRPVRSLIKELMA